jgi:hypothetical protein
MDGDTGPEVAARSLRSSELLGYPPDVRVLIVNNDDFGMYHAINAAVLHSIEEGIASSCSFDSAAPVGAARHAPAPPASEESRAIDPVGWLRRRADYEFLTSTEARELLQQEKIHVIDYRAIRQAWSQASTP